MLKTSIEGLTPFHESHPSTLNHFLSHMYLNEFRKLFEILEKVQKSLITRTLRTDYIYLKRTES
jgi:hypothetical protein